VAASADPVEESHITSTDPLAITLSLPDRMDRGLWLSTVTAVGPASPAAL